MRGTRVQKKETKHNDWTHRGRGSYMHRNVNTDNKTDSHRRHKRHKKDPADERLNWEHKKTQKHRKNKLKMN